MYMSFDKEIRLTLENESCPNVRNLRTQMIPLMKALVNRCLNLLYLFNVSQFYEQSALERMTLAIEFPATFFVNAESFVGSWAFCSLPKPREAFMSRFRGSFDEWYSKRLVQLASKLSRSKTKKVTLMFVLIEMAVKPVKECANGHFRNSPLRCR